MATKKADDPRVRELVGGLLSALDDQATRSAVAAERAFLRGLGGGCAVPVAAYGETVLGAQGPAIKLTGLVMSVDGKQAIRLTGESSDAQELGQDLAQKAIAQGADEILAIHGVQ